MSENKDIYQEPDIDSSRKLWEHVIHQRELAETDNLAEKGERRQLEKVRKTLQAIPPKAEELTLKSRETRLAFEEANKKRGFFRRMIRSRAGKWVVKPIIEMIPSPVGYGPGDIITGIGALTGKDFLSGEDLDLVDRILYGVATGIPYVPSTVIVEPARFVRKQIEETVHKRSTKKNRE